MQRIERLIKSNAYNYLVFCKNRMNSQVSLDFLRKKLELRICKEQAQQHDVLNDT